MLKFKDITLDSIDEIRPFLFKQNYRTCDYTIGGIMMWSEFFDYKYCIYKDMLYIIGNSAKNYADKPFAVPVGYGDFKGSVLLLWDYCIKNNIPLSFSAVPKEAVPALKSVFRINVERLENWSDYLYNSSDLSTYKGRKYNRKRNHVNKFMKNYPDFEYERITPGNIIAVKEFFSLFQNYVSKNNDIFRNEEKMVKVVLNNYSAFGFVGGVLKVGGKVVAFTIGEVVNDTLFIHIEKASREYAGIYETLSLLFARDLTDKNIEYINREEDVGDEGLRKSKMSYNPIALLDKYNVEVMGIAT